MNGFLIESAMQIDEVSKFYRLFASLGALSFAVGAIYAFSSVRKKEAVVAIIISLFFAGAVYVDDLGYEKLVNESDSILVSTQIYSVEASCKQSGGEGAECDVTLSDPDELQPARMIHGVPIESFTVLPETILCAVVSDYEQGPINHTYMKVVDEDECTE